VEYHMQLILNSYYFLWDIYIYINEFPFPIIRKLRETEAGVAKLKHNLNSVSYC
jgi:hypothetical protein